MSAAEGNWSIYPRSSRFVCNELHPENEPVTFDAVSKRTARSVDTAVDTAVDTKGLTRLRTRRNEVCRPLPLS